MPDGFLVDLHWLARTQAEQAAYDAHKAKTMKELETCALNCLIWSGTWDTKLKAEWDAAILLGKKTVILYDSKVEVPPELAKHPIVIATQPFDRGNQQSMEVAARKLLDAAGLLAKE